MLATFGPSRHVTMVWRVVKMSATSRACRARETWRTTRQTGKVTRILRECYEETAPVEFIVVYRWRSPLLNATKACKFYKNTVHSTLKPRRTRKIQQHLQPLPNSRYGYTFLALLLHAIVDPGEWGTITPPSTRGDLHWLLQQPITY